MSSKEHKVILGDEYDEDLKDALRSAIKKLGGVVAGKDWSIGGSQELLEVVVKFGDSSVVIESETYEGLSIRGEKSIVEKLSEMVKTQNKSK